MNDEELREFEKRVRSLGRRKPSADWRAEILDRATDKETSSWAWWLPPRWLGMGLAACWVLVLGLNLIAPPREAGGDFLAHDFSDEWREQRRLIMGNDWQEADLEGGRP